MTPDWWLIYLAEGEKSATQKAGDSASSGSKDAQGQAQGYLASAQETVGNAAQSAGDALGLNSAYFSLLSETVHVLTISVEK